MNTKLTRDDFSFKNELDRQLFNPAYDLDITANVRLVYYALSHYADFATGKGARPAIGTVARHLKLSRTSVHKYISILVEKGLVTSVGGHRGNHSGSLINVYDLHLPSDVLGMGVVSDSPVEDPGPADTPELPTVDESQAMDESDVPDPWENESQANTETVDTQNVNINDPWGTAYIPAPVAEEYDQFGRPIHNGVALKKNGEYAFEYNKTTTGMTYSSPEEAMRARENRKYRNTNDEAA